MYTLFKYTFKTIFTLMFLPFICLKWMFKLFWGIFGWIFIILGLCLDDGRF